MESSWSNERLSFSSSLSCSSKATRWATPIWLTGPRWDHVSQPDGGNRLPGNHSGKKAFTFIAFGLRLPLRPLHRFYSALQNATEQGPSISGGYLTDPLYRRRLKGLLRIIIQSKISAPNQLSLVTSKVGLKWETTEDERHFESHFWFFSDMRTHHESRFFPHCKLSNVTFANPNKKMTLPSVFPCFLIN